MKLKENNGLFRVIEQHSPVTFDAYYRSDISQITIYFNEPISEKTLNKIKSFVAKYIEDNMLQDRYRVVNYFYFDLK